MTCSIRHTVLIMFLVLLFQVSCSVTASDPESVTSSGQKPATATRDRPDPAPASESTPMLDVEPHERDTIPAATSTEVKSRVDQEISGANADVLFVTARHETGDSWTFAVTVAHPDSGWEDYADGWDVVLPDGSSIKPDSQSPFTRLLLHPHENEQPFTRSQSGIIIPAGVGSVTVRAHDIVDGFGGREVLVDLMTESGPDFEVQRSAAEAAE